jgi:hypothetical protein
VRRSRLRVFAIAEVWRVDSLCRTYSVGTHSTRFICQSQLTSRECSHVCLSHCEQQREPGVLLARVCQSALISILHVMLVSAAGDGGDIRVCSLCQSGLCVRGVLSFP